MKSFFSCFAHLYYIQTHTTLLKEGATVIHNHILCWSNKKVCSEKEENIHPVLFAWIEPMDTVFVQPVNSLHTVNEGIWVYLTYLGTA